MGRACTGISGVLVMTASNEFEPSKADMKDPDMGIWLSNGFTRTFMNAIGSSPDIFIRDLYYKVAKGTVGSHVTVYNAENFGNLYRASINEFISIH